MISPNIYFRNIAVALANRNFSYLFLNLPTERLNLSLNLSLELYVLLFIFIECEAIIKLHDLFHKRKQKKQQKHIIFVAIKVKLLLFSI